MIILRHYWQELNSIEGISPVAEENYYQHKYAVKTATVR